MHLTVVPEGIGVGTLEVGDKRYALLRMVNGPLGELADMTVDIAVSFADLGALIAEASDLRAREVSRT